MSTDTNTTPTAENLARQIEELRERGAAATLKARQDAAERRAELQRIDAEESARLVELEREYGPTIAQKELQAQILRAEERVADTTEAAAAAKTAADAGREGLPEAMRELAVRFLAWRDLENTLAVTESARLQGVDELARVNGTAPAPTPTHHVGGVPQFDQHARQPVRPREWSFTDWRDPLVWLASAAAASQPEKNDLSRGFTVTPPR